GGTVGDHHHPDTHVESSVHLSLCHVAEALKKLEHGEHRPRALVDFGARAGGQDSRHVLEQAAAGYMSERFYQAAVQQTRQRIEIASMRLQELFGGRATQVFDRAVVAVSRLLKDQLARKAVPICMKSYRRQSYQFIACDDARAVDHS